VACLCHLPLCRQQQLNRRARFALAADKRDRVLRINSAHTHDSYEAVHGLLLSRTRRPAEEPFKRDGIVNLVSRRAGIHRCDTGTKVGVSRFTLERVSMHIDRFHVQRRRLGSAVQCRSHIRAIEHMIANISRVAVVRAVNATQFGPICPLFRSQKQ
jgi:hypothetical protein